MSIERLLPDPTSPPQRNADRRTRPDGVSFGSFLAGLCLASAVGASGGFIATKMSFAEAIHSTAKVRVVDLAAVAMQGVRAGDVDAGVEHAREVVRKLVEDGYVVIQRGAVIDAPANVQIPAPEG